MEPKNYYSCSSWNYGTYAPCNPYFVQQYKYPSIPTQSRYIPHPNNNVYNNILGDVINYNYFSFAKC